MKNHKNICFQRFKAEKLKNEKEPFIFKLIPDPVIDYVSESRKAGLVKLTLNIFKDVEDKTKYLFYKDDNNIKKNDVMNLKSYYVVANVFQVNIHIDLEQISYSRR